MQFFIFRLSLGEQRGSRVQRGWAIERYSRYPVCSGSVRVQHSRGTQGSWCVLLQQRDSLSEINNNTALNYFIQSSHPAWAAHCLSWHWNHPPLHLCQHKIPSSGRTTGDVPCEFCPFVPIVPNGAFNSLALPLLLLLGVPTPWPRTTRHPKPLECNCTWRHSLGTEIPEPFQMHSATLAAKAVRRLVGTRCEEWS